MSLTMSCFVVAEMEILVRPIHWFSYENIEKETIIIFDSESSKDDNKELHTQIKLCTYKFRNFLRELMVLGIGPTKPLAWMTL